MAHGLRPAIVCWACLGLLGLGGCDAGGEPAVRDLSSLEESLCEGDLLFRRGRGVTSRVVLAADARGAYSHVGIAHKEDGRWLVVHAVPGEGEDDRVKMEPLSVFFLPGRAQNGAAMRFDDSRAAASAARRAIGLYRAGIFFDHSYDLNDSVKMYCTELIYRVFLHEGIDLTDGRRTRIDLPGFRDDYILPADLQAGRHLGLIYEF